MRKKIIADFEKKSLEFNNEKAEGVSLFQVFTVCSDA